MVAALALVVLGAVAFVLLRGAEVPPAGVEPPVSPEDGAQAVEMGAPPVRRLAHPAPAKVTHFQADHAPEGMTPAEAPPPGLFKPDFVRGMAVGLYMDLPQLPFAQLFAEIKATGATHVSLIVAWSQAHIRAVEIAPHPVETMPDARVREVIGQARAAGLEVMLFPIVHIDRRRSGEWRGKLAPVDADRWWSSYEGFIAHYAALAQDTGVDILAVGSELLTMEGERARWESVVARTRGVFQGRLIYSANWDHFDHVVFWDLLDLAGMTGYFELSDSPQPTLAELRETWEGAVEVIDTYIDRAGKPLILTEVGYPSQIGAAAHPWDYTRRKAPDVQVQYLSFRAMYEAYLEVFKRHQRDGRRPPLNGVFVWNWYGYGGSDDIGYTLRGKPAEAIVRRWFMGR